ncbi:phosphopantetheine-binding protein [Vibrio mediterranei]|nr:phosphopantetheine-binding protein [Vibrio mediterranei]
MTNNIVTKEIILEAIQVAEIECEITDFSITFDEAGLDSLDIFNLFLELETLTGHKVEDEDLGKFHTFNDILTNYFDI